MTQITIAAVSDVTWRYSQFTTFTSHRLMLDWVHIWSCYYNNCILGRSHPERGSQEWRKQVGVNNTQLNTFTCVHSLGISFIHKTLIWQKEQLLLDNGKVWAVPNKGYKVTHLILLRLYSVKWYRHSSLLLFYFHVLSYYTDDFTCLSRWWLTYHTT